MSRSKVIYIIIYYQKADTDPHTPDWLFYLNQRSVERKGREGKKWKGGHRRSVTVGGCGTVASM